jgi:hypothetical protein
MSVASFVVNFFPAAVASAFMERTDVPWLLPAPHRVLRTAAAGRHRLAGDDDRQRRRRAPVQAVPDAEAQAGRPVDDAGVGRGGHRLPASRPGGRRALKTRLLDRHRAGWSFTISARAALMMAGRATITGNAKR